MNRSDIPAPATAEIFQATLAGHLPLSDFIRLSSTSVLVAGLGAGSNVAELLVRKGVGRLLIADPGVYEHYDVRQRGSLASTWGHPKAEVVRKRLQDVNPKAKITPVKMSSGSREMNALLDQVDYVVDALNFHALPTKLALHRAARRRKKTVVTPCPVVNGAALWVFTPKGPAFEAFLACDGRPETASLRLLQRLVPESPPIPEDLRRAVARGVRTPPLDAVGVDQAAVLAVAAIENLVLGRHKRVITVPRGLFVDVSEPGFLARVLE
ncbi:MAG TPA: ThiF family adenylyltransferase [Planctomycetota bacterium]